jgi:hypothetical protein
MSAMVRALAVTFSPSRRRPGSRPAPAPVLVAQRQRQPVDLGLGGEGQRRVGAEAEIAADAGVEIAHVVVASKALASDSIRWHG